MSTNNRIKKGFTSLTMKKEINQNFGTNNKIYYSNSNMQKKSQKNNIIQSKQENAKFNKIEKTKIKGNKTRNKSAIKIALYSSIENGSESNDQMNKNNLRVSKASKDKDKNSSYIFKPKADKKKHLNHIERIIIDLVSKDDDNTSIQTDSDKFKDEQLIQNNTIKSENREYIFNKENKENKGNKENNIIIKKESLKTALNMVGTRWINNYKSINEEKFSLLSDDIWKKKKEIEIAMNRWKNMEINNGERISFKKEKEKDKENEVKNSVNRWENNLQKENKEVFTLEKNINKDNFLYSENNYIKDLIKNIYIPKDKENTFCFLNNNNYSNDFNHIDYKIIESNNKDQLENDLHNFYKEKKINYLKNKDNNEELKINPIYVLTDKQINQIYEDLNKDIISNKKDKINPALSIEKQKWIDFEIIEIFTPKNKNKDNNTNPNSKRYSSGIKELKNDKVSEINYEGHKKSSEEFGQETPFSMLNEKFNIYAVSKNNKFSVPERQDFFNYSNQAKRYNLGILQKSTFNLNIQRCENLDNNKKILKESENSNDNNIIDYSKRYSNSNSSKNK